MSTWYPENLILKNQLKLGHFVFLAFLKITAGDLHALLAVLVLPLVRLGEVHRRAISHTPLQLLLGGILGEGEADPLTLHPQPTHQQ
jgi:hypothetical protein